MRRRTTFLVALATALITATLVASGVGAVGRGFWAGGGRGNAALSCPGGMVRLGHVLDLDAEDEQKGSVSVFPGDPRPTIKAIASIEADGFLLEVVTIGTHTGTHLSAPGHFKPDALTVDELDATEFVWPAYIIDVRDHPFADEDLQLQPEDIRRAERAQGRIPRGALVILFTGFQEKWATEGYETDPAPGFSGAAVHWMFRHRHIGGLASDTFGPDATSDEEFLASSTAYENGGITIENMTGIDQLHPTGDLVIAPTVALAGGSGYQNDPLGCLSRDRRHRDERSSKQS